MSGRSRAPLLILAAVAIAIVAALALAGPGGGGDSDPSSIASGRGGTLALYNWLGSLGFNVHRIEGDFDLSSTDVLISVAPNPTSPYDDADARRVVDHLDRGGDVILATTNPLSVATLLHATGLRPAGVTEAPAAAPAQPFDPSGAVRTIPLGRAGSPPSSLTLGSDRTDMVPLLVAGQDPVAVVVLRGGGRIYLIGSTFPMSNDGLRAGDSAAFILSLVERARGGRIGFDEVHHQLRAGSGDQGISAVFRGPLLVACLLAVLVALLYLASSARRLGPPLPARDPSRVPSAAEYVASIGHLLARSKQRGSIAGRYATELKQRVGAVTGADPRFDDDGFVAAVAGFGEARARRTGALLARARALAAARPRETELVALAQAVHQLENEWGAGPSPGQNGPP